MQCLRRDAPAREEARDAEQQPKGFTAAMAVRQLEAAIGARTAGVLYAARSEGNSGVLSLPDVVKNSSESERHELEDYTVARHVMVKL